MIKSEVALRKGIDNTPSDEIIVNLQILCRYVLQPIRDSFNRGVKVNSGYRSPAVNSAVGGVLTSDHCKGFAADIEIPGIANSTLARWVCDNLKFTQCILEFYTPGILDSGWVHVSYIPNNLKCQCLTAVKQDDRIVYMAGILE